MQLLCAYDPMWFKDKLNFFCYCWYWENI